MPGPLDGRVALITGASSGIGKGTAVALARSGATVALAARRAQRLHELAREIEDAGGRALVLPGDMTDEAVVTQVVDETAATLGRLDVLINSAGILQPGRVENAVTAEWRRAMDINFLGTLYACKAAIPHMKAVGGGDIVNISSTAARRHGGVGVGPYSASKHALNVMSEGLRQEVGGSGIRVCVLEPGATNTEVAEGVADPALRESMRQHVSREGTLQIEDVGNMIAFIVAMPPYVNVSEILIRPTSDTIPM